MGLDEVQRDAHLIRGQLLELWREILSEDGDVTMSAGGGIGDLPSVDDLWVLVHGCDPTVPLPERVKSIRRVTELCKGGDLFKTLVKELDLLVANKFGDEETKGSFDANEDA